MKQAIMAASLCVCAVTAGFGQPAAGAPAFDVSSVKRSDLSGAVGEGGRKQQSVRATPGALNLRNFSLKSCVQWAYNLKDYQVTGPGWIESERYDIVAKAAGPANDDELRKMLQTLLADRFKLVFHREIRELPVYALMVGKDGPKMKQSEGDATGNINGPRGGKNSMVLAADHTSMVQFADMISGPLQRAVIDETGLKGGFAFNIDLSKYIDEEMHQKLESQGHGAPDMAPTIEAILTMALREQLGLKLESKKSPINMIVVEKAEKVPTEN